MLINHLLFYDMYTLYIHIKANDGYKYINILYIHIRANNGKLMNPDTVTQLNDLWVS